MKSTLTSRRGRVAAVVVATIAAVVAVAMSALSSAPTPAPLADFDTSPMSVPTPSHT